MLIICCRVPQTGFLLKRPFRTGSVNKNLQLHLVSEHNDRQGEKREKKLIDTCVILFGMSAFEFKELGGTGRTTEHTNLN